MLSQLQARTRHGARAGHAEPPLFLLRAEHHEADFLAAHATDLHGAVLLGRNLAPHHVGSPPQREGLRGDELAQTVRKVRIDHIHDPDTAILPLLRGDESDRARFGRAQNMAAARAVPTGVQAGDLVRDDALGDLVVAALRPQMAVSFPAAPYFRFGSVRDPWLDVNVRAAAMSQSTARGAAVAVFAQVDVAALRDGVLAAAASRYADALSPRGIAFLQVAGLHPEDADEDDLYAYLAAVDAWRTAGFAVIADRIGRFGVAAVGAGADGLACGTRVYRTMPDAEQEFQYSRAGSLRYWAPGRGDSFPVGEARKRARRGTLDPCPVARCAALDDAATLDDVRWHDIHLVCHELEQVYRDRQGFAALWSSSPRNYVRAWGRALQRAARSADEA